MADLCYEVTKLEDCDELADFLGRSFFTREPTTVGLHLTSEDHRNWVNVAIKTWATCGASYLCRDKANGNKIVGCRLSKFVSRDDGLTFGGHDTQGNEKLDIFFHILCELEACQNFFETENVDKIMEFVAVGVDENYGGKGIATKLIQLSMQKGKELGAQLVTVQATNFISQKIFINLGFEVKYVLDYATYEFKGKKVFDTKAQGKSVCSKVLTKRL
ncbi:arylalkylamine N-acetyltransferase-like 2 [Oratosquilla oratoria]|uniref:arylalkylamine N-acetyltransferase-like 2 n=1 Tax=Oratosquilla oratoria TaxID=337810 RepID=UPI003F76FFB0